ncbi:MAG: hypothetical protein HFJ10_04790, partial [Lachnospiraceae bacterium]|nr:hypothetical protein [Lachnospiraceae bacterium]
MRRMGLIKRGLMLVLCGMLAVPAVGMWWEPMVAEATETTPDSKNPDSDSDNEPGDGNTVDPEQSLKDLKISAQNELDDYLELKKSD